MLETFDPVETIDKLQAALNATARGLLRSEANWTHCGCFSASIVTDADMRPQCVIVRMRDHADCVDRVRCYLIESLYQAELDFVGEFGGPDLTTLLGDITEFVVGALNE
jgi:hypothetical protein